MFLSKIARIYFVKKLRIFSKELLANFAEFCRMFKFSEILSSGRLSVPYRLAAHDWTCDRAIIALEHDLPFSSA